MKKLRKVLIMSLVLVGLSVFIYSIKNAAFAWGGNDDFLDSSFWATNPTNTGIIAALYGDGNGGTDRTAYSNDWTGSVNCNINSMSVVYVNSGTNAIPPVLSSNTVYVLNGGLYTLNYSGSSNGGGYKGSVSMNNCSAIVGRGDSTIRDLNLKSLGTIITIDRASFTILDNINVDGRPINAGNSSSGGVSVFSGINSTFHNINAFYSTMNIYLRTTWSVIIDGGNFYNNGSGYSENNIDSISLFHAYDGIIKNVNLYDTYVGIRIQGYSQRNFIDNCNINNASAGIQLEGNSQENVINNCVISNTHDGIRIQNNSQGNVIEYCDIYNMHNGITLRDNAQQNTINHSKVYKGNIGLWMFGSNVSHNLVKNSQFYNNTYAGIFVEKGSDYNDFSNIQAFNNVYIGMFIRASVGGYSTTGTNPYFVFTGFTDSDRNEYNTVTNSQFYNNQYGISLFGANHTIINRTRVYNNAVGLGMTYSQDNILNDFGIANNKYGILTTTGSTNNTWYGSMRSNPNTTKYCYSAVVSFGSPAGSISCAISTPLGGAGHAGILTPGAAGNRPTGWMAGAISNNSAAMSCGNGTDTINASGSRFHPTTSCNTISTGLMFSRAPTQPVLLNGNVMGGGFLRQIPAGGIYHFVGTTITLFYPESDTCAMVGDPDFINVKCINLNPSKMNDIAVPTMDFRVPNGPGLTAVPVSVYYKDLSGDVANNDYNTLNNIFITLGIEDLDPVDVDHVSVNFENFDINESATISNFVLLGVDRGSITIPAGSTLKVTIHMENGSPVVEDGLVIGDDLVAPTITLNGDATVNVYLNDVYTDAGATATDDVDGNITQNIVTDNMVNTSAIGEYHVTYTVSDAANNHAQVIRTVNVLAPADTTPPTITLNGSSSVTIYQNDTYTDAGATAYDNVDGNITSSITVNNQVNTSTVGTYYVTYTVVDAANNSAQLVRVVEVITALPPPDTTPPTITLNGNSSVDVYLNDAYNDQGAYAYDNVDGDITSSITVNNQVDTSTIGTYSVIYDVSDSSNNHTQVTRVVHVLMPADTTPPTITINGSATVNMDQYATYTDAGATAYDNVDGNITSSITTDNQVNTSVVGTYYVMYDVYDAANNHDQAIRVVIVSSVE